eukprot:1152682-Pelagomonas_calceolata.AAC.1
MGIWRVTGSTRLQDLAVRSIVVFNSTPSGDKLVGIHSRVDMKFVGKKIDTLVVQSQGLHAAAVPPPTVTVVQASCLCSIWFQSSAHAAGLHFSWGKKEKKKKWVWLDREDLKLVLHQPIITSYVRVNRACSQLGSPLKGLLLRALMIILPAILRACGVCCLIGDSLGEGITGCGPLRANRVFLITRGASAILSRLTLSRPDAIPITAYHTKLTSSSPSPSSRSHHMLRRHGTSQRTSVANRTRGLDSSWRWHNGSMQILQNISGKAVTLYTILLGVGGTCYTLHTLNLFEHLGLDNQRVNELAHKLHTHSVMYANKLVTTRRAIENNDTSYSQVLGPGASRNPPDPH